MSLTREAHQIIRQDAERVGGQVCFFGTRVPVQHMLDYVHGGQTLNEFSIDYNIPLKQAQAVLELIVPGLETLLVVAA